MVSSCRRVFKMKRSFLTFRRPLFLVLLVVTTGLLVHHMAQVKEVIKQREAKPAKEKMDSLIELKDIQFNSEDILVSSPEAAKSILSDQLRASNGASIPGLKTKTTGEEKKQIIVDTKEKKDHDTKPQTKDSQAKVEINKGKTLDQNSFRNRMTENDPKVEVKIQNSDDTRIAKDNGQEKPQAETSKHAQPKPAQVNQPQKTDSGLKNQKAEKDAFSRPIEKKEMQQKYTKKRDQSATKLTKDKYSGGSPVKYLIYLCDKKVYCYGLGDRQRAIVSTYYLAELTGRRFGLIMTAPSDIRDFYEPNLVKWDIKESDLPKNASTYELSALGLKVDLHLDKIDFNSVYPQDVIYIRTNQVYWFSTLKNPIYRNKIPSWARIHHSSLIPLGWLRLMKPTPLLRTALNSALNDIAKKIQEEAEVAQVLVQNQCCKNVGLPKILPTCSKNKNVCSKNMTVQNCCDTMERANFVGCPELRLKCSRVNSKNCENILSSSFPKRWNGQRTQTLTQNYCTMPPSISKLNGSIESISTKKGFDLTDMNLICAHIRLGKSKTFPFETYSFNNDGGISGVWDFLKTFAKKGYHMYLASDAQEVKDEARGIFGDRLHMAEAEIVHIAFAQKEQDVKAGLEFTLMEQLLLTTSCREILMSHSGYSGRAVEIRNKLMQGKTGRVYHYRNGIVT